MELPVRPAVWPDARVLSGETVRIEKLLPAVHGDSLWETTGGLRNAALWEYMGDGPFATRAEMDDALARASEKRDPMYFAIVEQGTGRAVGRCSYLNIRPEHGVIEVGNLVFSGVLQRTRAATEALYLLARNAFDVFGYRRYEWKCNALNEKSRRAALRTGFVFEGVFRQHMIVKGRNRDTAWFSILDREWPGVRAGFEGWLAAENFDEKGEQRRRLGEFTTSGTERYGTKWDKR
jgi:RimJ/RimL family protein N-acetyltransferase